MKTWIAVSLLGIAMLGGCNEREATDGEARAVASTTVATSEAEAQLTELGHLAFPTGVTGKPDSAEPAGEEPKTAEERVQAVKDYIAAHSECADPVPSGSVLNITFSKTCTWAGRRWAGTVVITYSSADAATLTMEGLTIQGGALSGTLTVERKAEGHLVLDADWTAVREGVTRTGAWDAEYMWDDEAYTVVHAKHVLTLPEGQRTLETSDLVWKREELTPESGTITFTALGGRTWTVVFEGDTVTVTPPSGETHTFDSASLVE